MASLASKDRCCEPSARGCRCSGEKSWNGRTFSFRNAERAEVFMRLFGNTRRRCRFDVPYPRAVIPDGPVGGELAHTCRVQDGPARPGQWITPERTDFFLCLDVSLVIGEHEERILPKQVVHKRTEQVRAAARQRAAGDEVE